MDRSDKQTELLERICGAATRAVLLEGPAACGKSTAAMALYRQAEPAAMILGPNAPAAQAVRRRLLDESPGGVVVSPNVLTLAALAGRFLARSPDGAQPGRMLPELQRHLLLRRLIDELAEDGRLEGFRSVLDTRGLVTSIDSTIAELKRAAIEPEDFAAAAPVDEVGNALHAVYQRYQQELLAENVYDLEGQMWQARNVLRQLSDAGVPSAAMAGIDTLIVDGFTDFTPTQLEALALLAGQLKRLLITLPYDAAGPKRLWHWTRRTRDNIVSAFGDELTIVSAQPQQRSGVGVLWDRVFTHDVEPVAPPAEVSLIATAGIEQEVALAAAKIKRRLLDGEPCRVAVIARSLGEYRPVIERVFARSDIPISDAAVSVTSVPAVRYLLSVASLAPEFAGDSVLVVIGNSYFRPEALGDFDARTVAAAKALIREANILGGRNAYAQAVQRFGRQAQRHADDDEDQHDHALLASPEAITQAGEMLTALFDLPGSDLLLLTDALGLPQAVCESGEPRRIARDLRALAALETALAGLEVAPPVRLLADALANVTCPPSRGESIVDVLDCLDARACRYDHVYLLGLTDGQFPRRFVETPLLSERSRQELVGAGLGIDRRDDLTAREMLLFYLSVSRCDRTLTMGTLQSDAAGRPSAPSAFLTALGRCMGGLDDVPTQKVPLSRLVPPSDQLLAEADAANRAWQELFDSPDAHSPALRWMAANAPDTIRRTAMGAWAAHRRWQFGECDSFDGRITDPKLLAELAARYPGQMIFSASQLERYAQCPWRFFASYVLGLTEPMTGPRHLDAPRRGQLCHDILFELFMGLAEAHGRPLRLAEIDEEVLESELTAVVARVTRRHEQRHSPPYPVLWRIQIDRLARQIRRYVLQWRSDGRWQAGAMHFELAFGMEPHDDDELMDADSSPDAVIIETPAGPIRLRGRIDRIDHVDTDLAEGLLVVDYKTGSLPARKNIDAGVAVQIPLYAIAAEQLLGEHCIGGIYQQVGDKLTIRSCAEIKTWKQSLAADGHYAETKTATIDAVGRYVSAMATGRFDDLPAGGKCPHGCAFRETCHFSPARSKLKLPSPEDSA